jgi:hypothetical protein
LKSFYDFKARKQGHAEAFFRAQPTSLVIIFLLLNDIFMLTFDAIKLDSPSRRATMNRMQRLSRALRIFASWLLFVMVASLIFLPVMLFTDDFILKMANDTLRQLDVEGARLGATHLGWRLRISVVLPMAVYAVTILLSLGALIRLLHQFEWGEAFSAESIRLIRFLGWIQVAMAPMELLILWGTTGTVKALTGQAIHPWAQIAGSVMGNLFFGGVVLLIAYVMEEGFRLKSEQDLVI